ncbi:MAG: hypothetical protein LQ346_003590 [Caloplaca aetnensis]|nr:MAG: hypothetical protein LQ346_003590 [Caloplaca aetnensis]
MNNEEQRQLRLVEEAARKVHAALETNDSPSSKLEPVLQGYRVACQNLALEHLDLASNKSIESKLWDVHVRVNGRFRKQLGEYKGLKGKEKKPVETRKAAKVYLDFVKASQRFYRGYLQNLASQYGRIPELEAVAHRFSPDRTW